jgi:hypothetical protein
MRGGSPRPLPSVEYLRACFDYDVESGALISPCSFPRRAVLGHAGKKAGTVDNHGYRRVHAGNGSYRVNRIATKWMTGEGKLSACNADGADNTSGFRGDGTRRSPREAAAAFEAEAR